MNATKVIIDCDPGIDDALALMLALRSPELEILGITVVSGNVPAKQGAENAKKILHWMDRMDIPVYLGEELPLVIPYVDAMDTHGTDGLGESHYPKITDGTIHKNGVEFIARTLQKAALENETVSVIALGPLTNLARVIQMHPDSLDGLGELVSMGGSYRSHGNCSPVAEYNYWCDPHAAEIVFRAFEELLVLQDKQIHMVGLDVTRKIVLTPNLLEYMCVTDPKMGERIRRITRFYFDFHWKQEGVIGCVINDPLAVAYFIDRSLCSGIDACTRIATEGLCIGQSVVDGFDIWNGKKNTHVLTEVDEMRFMQMFLERLFQIPEEKSLPVLEQILSGGVR
ncbi:MAG: nucleoside hydrolase [[Ruminococcus] gnavus]|nr:nucleoside hydrolase [Mediterraneibacter gnavus]